MGASTPLLATDLKSPPQSYPDERQGSGKELTEEEVAEFCYSQRKICRKICNLRSRFEDRFDGCPQSCDSRESRCSKTACYKWSEPEYIIAERFGGFKCVE